MCIVSRNLFARLSPSISSTDSFHRSVFCQTGIPAPTSSFFVLVDFKQLQLELATRQVGEAQPLCRTSAELAQARTEPRRAGDRPLSQKGGGITPRAKSLERSFIQHPEILVLPGHFLAAAILFVPLVPASKRHKAQQEYHWRSAQAAGRGTNGFVEGSGIYLAIPARRLPPRPINIETSSRLARM